MSKRDREAFRLAAYGGGGLGASGWGDVEFGDEPWEEPLSAGEEENKERTVAAHLGLVAGHTRAAARHDRRRVIVHFDADAFYAQVG